MNLLGASPSTSALAAGHHGPVASAEQPSVTGQARPEPASDADPKADDAPVREQVSLTDGTTVVVRAVEPADAEALTAGYQQLSATSAYRRFFTTYPRLSPAQVRYFTAVDHHDHEALGAVTAHGEGIGIARYIRDPHNPHSAELAIVILDTWQRLGVGQQLMRVLCDRARDEGITTLVAEVLADNAALPALLRRFGTVHTDARGSTTHATLDLGDRADR